MLLDDDIPFEHRRHLIADLCQSDSKEATRILKSLLQAAASGSEGDRYKEKTRELEQLIEALESGPQRPGIFLNLVTPVETPIVRAHVKLADGSSAYPIVVDGELAAKLKRGDCVMLSARAELLLARDPGRLDIGEEAQLEAWIDDRVEVSLHSGNERHVMYVTDELKQRLASGEVETGNVLLVCVRRQIAFDVVPRTTDELSTFRFLSREAVPDVLVERDIGDPPSFPMRKSTGLP